MEHICGPMRRGECLEHGGNVKCQWGYVTSNHWANYGPYESPVSHCCNCKGFPMPENFADIYWTTAPASWVWNGNWKNTHTSTGTELPICDPTDAPTPSPTRSPTLSPTMNPTVNPTLAPSVNPTLTPTADPTKAQRWVESTGACTAQDGSYSQILDLPLSWDQCKGACERNPDCTSFKHSHLKGPAHNSWSVRCILDKANRGCNEQEKQASIQNYRNLGLDCCLDLSCPNNQYISGIAYANIWICMNTWTKEQFVPLPPTTEPTPSPTPSPTLGCTDNCVSTPGWTIDSNPVTTCGWMEHICGPMRRGECLEHGGNVKCQWGYVTSNHWANYGPYGSPVSHCCNCKGFQMPENFADSYWTTAPASWVWNGNWKNTYSSTGTELPICDPTPNPTPNAPLTSDTAISLKQGSQYVSCVGGTNCKLEPNFSDSAKLMFRKGYNKANGNENGDHSDSSVIEVGDAFVIVLSATANTFYPTLDCSSSTCSYQNHMNTGQGHWGSPNKINIAGGSGAVSIGDQIRFTQMSGGWNAWNADWGISCDATKCGGAAGGGAIFTVCDSNGDCGTSVPVNCVMNQWENSGGCSATCGVA